LTEFSDDLAQRVLACVNVDRLAALALDLVQIQSYTGDTREATDRFAEAMRAAGLELEWFRFPEYANTPGLIGRLRGTGGGKHLELNGHMDTIPLRHDPARIEDGALFGRGATDMKASLACSLEAVIAVREAGVSLQGDVLVSTHGMHEMPTGHGEDLAARLRLGVHGDAAIVTECGGAELPVVGVGMCTFEIILSRPGLVKHENSTPSDTPHPVLAAGKVLGLIQARGRILATNPLDHVGPPSIFVGEIHGGDFYNRFPKDCRIVGTRRWSPEERFAEIVAEFDALRDQVAAETGLVVEIRLDLGREGFRVMPGEKIASSLRQAYHRVTGVPLVDGGLRSVADASLFRHVAHIPAVYHGPVGTGHHGDVERIELRELERAARVLALTALDFCGITH
jgi:acetylornithine deacetylase